MSDHVPGDEVIRRIKKAWMERKRLTPGTSIKMLIQALLGQKNVHIFGGALRDLVRQAQPNDWDVVISVGTNSGLITARTICAKLSGVGLINQTIKSNGYASMTYGQLIAVVSGRWEPEGCTDDGIDIDLVFVTSIECLAFDFTVNSLYAPLSDLSRLQVRGGAHGISGMKMLTDTMRHIFNQELVPNTFVERTLNDRECQMVALQLLMRLNKFMGREEWAAKLPQSGVLKGIYNVDIDMDKLDKFDSDEGDICSVCMDSDSKIAVTLHSHMGVPHRFCPACIIEMLSPDRSDKCPCCREHGVFSKMKVPTAVVISPPVENQPKHLVYPSEFLQGQTPPEFQPRFTDPADPSATVYNPDYNEEQELAAYAALFGSPQESEEDYDRFQEPEEDDDAFGIVPNLQTGLG